MSLTQHFNLSVWSVDLPLLVTVRGGVQEESEALLDLVLVVDDRRVAR